MYKHEYSHRCKNVEIEIKYILKTKETVKRMKKVGKR